MKKTKYIIGLVVMLASLISISTQAQELKAWGGGGTDVGTTLCYAIVPDTGQNGSTPLVTYLNATSDKAASVVQFYNITNTLIAQAAGSATNVYVAATNGYGDNAVVIHKSIASGTLKRLVVYAPTASTNLAFTTTPSPAIAAGDSLFLCVTSGSIPVGNATKELDGGGIYAGQRGKPLLLEVDGTSACQINAVGVLFP